MKEIIEERLENHRQEISDLKKQRSLLQNTDDLIELEDKIEKLIIRNEECLSILRS